MAARAGRIAPAKRGQDSGRRVHAGEEVGIGDPGLLRLTVRLAGQIHDPAHRLDDEIVSRTGGIGPVLAEAGDRAIDEARIDRLQALEIEPEARQPTDLEILDQNVRLAGQRADLLLPRLRLQIHGDRRFAAVAGVEIGGAAVGGEGRAPMAGIVAAAGPLDLDHLGAEIGQQLPGPRPGEDSCQL